MAPDAPLDPNRQPSQLAQVGSAVRWTLGNLEQAFDQAVDEAFRTCTTILDDLGCAASDAASVAGDEPVPAVDAARFRSCEGPVADGEPGEGLGNHSAAA